VTLGLTPDKYRSQLEEKYGERTTDFADEVETVLRYFDAIQNRLAETYIIEKVLAIGGTGIVHVGHHKRFQQKVAIKINRPNLSAEERSMVANEAQLLPKLSHPNIISVLDLGTLCDHKSGFCECEQHPKDCDHKAEECGETTKLTYIVEPFITGSKEFFTNRPDDVEGTWLHERIIEIKRTIPEALEMGREDDLSQAVVHITTLLRDVAELFSQWVSLLRHLHSAHGPAENGYVYLDVKPANVLVSKPRHLTAIDFGSAEKLDPQDPLSIKVFFTKHYAHRVLKDLKGEDASSNRVMGGIKRADLKPRFDYFALGMSMLEILNAIAEIKSHVVPQLPLYRSLHFLATRLLDGENSTRPPARNFRHASQVFPGLRAEDYEPLRYDSLNDTHRDLEKELGRWSLEDRVPELASYSKDIVRVVPGYNTVLTPRLRGVIEHPLVARLKYVTQLGLVSLVYPTADHSRYDHSLGSYTYTTYYVKSLFNDLGNPLFRNLVGDADVKAVLLAALLHDLGQYPLAHDLEEVHRGIFKHTLLGEKLLEDDMEDTHHRTLMQIIEEEQNGWGVSRDALADIRGAHSRSKNLPLREQMTLTEQQTLPEQEETISLKTNVLTAIIDGQVDADKADYIIRDSVRCELPYGAQLDLERLLRVLTVAIIPQAGVKRVRLGVYDKGLVSAHAFGQARYELFSTVYWHHTARIIKAMLQYATAMGLPDEVFNPVRSKAEPKEIEIRERLLEFVKSLHPPFEVDIQIPITDREMPLALDEKPPDRMMSALSKESERTTHIPEPQEETDWYPGIAWTDWLMLRWIANLENATPLTRNLIHGLQKRRLYKRVATFERDSHKDLVDKLDNLPWPARVNLCKDLHKEVYEKINSKWGSLDTTTVTRKDFEILCKSNLLILVDVPSLKIGYARPIGVVPELREKSYDQGARQAHEDTPWHDIMVKMTEGIAPVRILCHPAVRNLVSGAYAASRSTDPTLEERIADEINRLLGGA